jgi:hypothetical protein
MDNYLGIVVEQSLRDPQVREELQVVAVKHGANWSFWLDSAGADELDQHIKVIQTNMVSAEHWYAHYFRGDELVVVFRDAVFRLRTDPATWEPAVTYGLAAGIPRNELDFGYVTKAQAEDFFGTKLP